MSWILFFSFLSFKESSFCVKDSSGKKLIKMSDLFHNNTNGERESGKAREKDRLTNNWITGTGISMPCSCPSCASCSPLFIWRKVEEKRFTLHTNDTLHIRPFTKQYTRRVKLTASIPPPAILSCIVMNDWIPHVFLVPKLVLMCRVVFLRFTHGLNTLEKYHWDFPIFSKRYYPLFTEHRINPLYRFLSQTLLVSHKSQKTFIWKNFQVDADVITHSFFVRERIHDQTVAYVLYEVWLLKRQLIRNSIFQDSWICFCSSTFFLSESNVPFQRLWQR